MGLKVRALEGEHGLRYYVQSRSDPEHPHLVDLASNDGWGQCSCMHWNCVIWPRVRDRRGFKHTSETTCAHVRAALHFFLDLALTYWIRSLRQHLSHDTPNRSIHAKTQCAIAPKPTL